MKITNEVLIYIEKLKSFFESNNEACEYFFNFPKENKFYGVVLAYSVDNFEKNGTPEVSKKQFEEIRKKLLYNYNEQNKLNEFKIPIEIMDIKFENVLYLN